MDIGRRYTVVLVVEEKTRKEEPPTMPKKRLTTNGNVFRRTDGRWQSVIWYFGAAPTVLGVHPVAEAETV